MDHNIQMRLEKMQTICNEKLYQIEKTKITIKENNIKLENKKGVTNHMMELSTLEQTLAHLGSILSKLY